MGEQLSNLRIAGVALVLFSAILLGVGIHHVIATGTCSSTGYSANFGPVPHCPSGTGAWFAFVFGGIIGALAGSMMAGGIGLVFASIFGGIGFGALTLLLDDHTASSTKVFGAAFGGVFALIALVALIAVLGSALSALRGSTRAIPSTSKTRTTNGGRRAGVRSGPIVAPSVTRSSGAGIVLGAPTGQPGLSVGARTGGSDTVESLTQLDDLHRQGVLTDTEFTAAKSKLISEL